MNHCLPAAYVFGPHGQAPHDPTDYDWEGREPPGSCNHLTCPRCKADVKVMASDDPKRRLYACQCFEHSASEGCWTTELHWTLFGDPVEKRNLPWTCGGHPPAELPVRFGDRTIDARAELIAATIDAAKDSARGELVLSLHHRTQTGSLERIVPEALAAAAAETGEAPMNEPLKKLFARNPALAPLASFAKQLTRSSPERSAQLVDILAYSITYGTPGVVIKDTIALLQRAALSGAITSEQLRILSYGESEWLDAHVEKLLARAPEHAGRILAWGGRSILLMGSYSEEASRRTQALALETGLSLETLVAQVEAGSGIWTAETRVVVEALRRMKRQ